jgi:hypothetical protein
MRRYVATPTESLGLADMFMLPSGKTAFVYGCKARVVELTEASSH